MIPFSEFTSWKEACFLIKQQGVYLEKSLLEKRADHSPLFFGCLWKDSWNSQTDPASFCTELLLQIDRLRTDLSAAFSISGKKLEVRFLDLNILSLVFSDCSEADVAAFCRKHEGEYHIRFMPISPTDPIGKYVFDTVHQLTSDRPDPGLSHALSVGLSFQQNYLVEVVSRDRREDPDLLLVEAVDQALLTHHALLAGTK